MATCRICGVFDPLGNEPSTQLKRIFNKHPISNIVIQPYGAGMFLVKSGFLYSSIMKELLDTGALPYWTDGKMIIDPSGMK